MTDAAPTIDDLPGYRRRFVVTPGDGWVRSDLEDDYHCMAVTLRHDAGVVTRVEPELKRAPWSTCPGAEAQLERTFTGEPLAGFAVRGEKNSNCTHLHDLATLAAAHAGDPAPLVYDVLRSDPVDGRALAELRRNGEVLLRWTIGDRLMILDPPALAGTSLMNLKGYLATLDPAMQEAVRIFRWGIMVGSGRSIPLDQQSDATRMPPNCFTFQPDMAAKAKRIGMLRSFAGTDAFPLDGRSPDRRDG